MEAARGRRRQGGAAASRGKRIDSKGSGGTIRMIGKWWSNGERRMRGE